MVTVTNTTRATTLADRCDLARTFWTRLVGLMGRATLEPGQGLLIYPESSIHMFGMRFPIDAVFVDQHDRVVGLGVALAPNRSFAAAWSARYVIELPAGTIAATGTESGDQLDVTPSPHPHQHRRARG